MLKSLANVDIGRCDRYVIVYFAIQNWLIWILNLNFFIILKIILRNSDCEASGQLANQVNRQRALSPMRSTDQTRTATSSNQNMIWICPSYNFWDFF